MPRTIAQHVIDNGNDVSQAFARTRTSREHIALPTPSRTNRFSLMLMQAQRSPFFVVRRFIFAKDLGTFPMQNTLSHQFIDRLAACKERIELDKRLRPEHPFLKFLLDIGANLRVADLDKALNVGGIVTDEPVAELENSHTLPSSRNKAPTYPRTPRPKALNLFSLLTLAQNANRNRPSKIHEVCVAIL